jgi:hypothetical protein
MLDMTGNQVIFFVFADLSVRVEGSSFKLRYRFFDLCSRMEDSEDIPVSAELFSGTFVIYSTKEFPGLQASTPLTKHLSRFGVRVNLREGERRRRSDDSSEGGSPGVIRGRSKEKERERERERERPRALTGASSPLSSLPSSAGNGSTADYYSNSSPYSRSSKETPTR